MVGMSLCGVVYSVATIFGDIGTDSERAKQGCIVHAHLGFKTDLIMVIQ